MKLSQWHLGKIKPVHVGVYERKLRRDLQSFSFWDGKKWSVCSGFTYVHINRTLLSGYQNLKWRGIVKWNLGANQYTKRITELAVTSGLRPAREGKAVARHTLCVLNVAIRKFGLLEVKNEQHNRKNPNNNLALCNYSILQSRARLWILSGYSTY